VVKAEPPKNSSIYYTYENVEAGTSFGKTAAAEKQMQAAARFRFTPAVGSAAGCVYILMQHMQMFRSLKM
jgi:hypothetical protein